MGCTAASQLKAANTKDGDGVLFPLLKAGLLYFVVVFGVGFVLGALRVLFVAPRIGERSAELSEMPIMCLVTIFTARWVVRHMWAPTRGRLIAIGSIALFLLAAAELAMVLLVRRVTVRDYLSSRDPVSGIAFLFMMVLFALMPVLVGTKARVAHDVQG